MLRTLKSSLYFFVAGYFKFFAAIQLGIWKPKVVVITGSNGKTTALHLIEAQLQSKARYSHHANSAYGIPFDILGLQRVTFARSEWLKIFWLAPIRAFKKPYPETLYVVEADCDRPREGLFLSSLLRPAVTIWLSSARTHSQNFDRLVSSGTFSLVDEAIAHEFGYFVEKAQELVIFNADNSLIKKQLKRSQARQQAIKESDLSDYQVTLHRSHFTIGNQMVSLHYLLPQETFYALAATHHLLQFLGQPLDPNFTKLQLPPGRSSILNGIKNTTIIDSSYNANLASTAAILTMVSKLASPKKWLILGDLIEQGQEEGEEHEKLADLVATQEFAAIILVGPRLTEYTYPLLRTHNEKAGNLLAFINPAEALHYLEKNLQGGEILVFKGARFLEGIIEHLLEDQKDVAKLCRREPIWQQRRRQWGL